MTRTELIAKLEAATEGSRELDCCIAYELGWRHNGFRESGEIRSNEFKRIMDMAGHWHTPGDRFADILNKAEYRKGFDEGRWPDEPPHYTTSLDAAMTLVDNSAFVFLLEWDDEPVEHPLRCSIMSGEKEASVDLSRRENWKAALPMMICIAAMKAGDLT